MKYYFVINPKAGKENIQGLEEEIKNIFDGLDFTIYYTKEAKDATRYVKDVCDSNKEELRFFACGGDGTINEVASALVNVKHASLVAYPCGSGNDFVRSFKTDFKDLKQFIDKKAKAIDILKVNDFYSINVANIGFDADVNAGVINLKKKMKVEKAYTKSLIKCLFKKFYSEYKVTIDDKEVIEGKFVLFTCSNASFYGGGYKCGPRAKIDDGLIDFCAINKISRLTFVRVVKSYKAGTYFEKVNPKIYVYRKCKKVTIESKNLMSVSLDGEMIFTKKIDVSILSNAVNLVY
ncbi:MAG: diacylglycerol kinase family lipid kinase [Erysipelotrichaceae bacterium]|nr:diacylglycerol kinase family lipid kinase [Erysipelotrichaceae bacterium]